MCKFEQKTNFLLFILDQADSIEWYNMKLLLYTADKNCKMFTLQ